MSTKLLHYGLQRSGTNYLEAIMKKRYRIKWINSNKDTRAVIQKHVRMYPEKDLVPEPGYRNTLNVPDAATFESMQPRPAAGYFIVSKDPYSWLLSYQKWAANCGWKPVDHHYIEEYNKFYGLFLEFGEQSDKFIFVQYNDLLRDLGGQLKSFEDKFNLQLRTFASRDMAAPKKVGHSGDFDDSRLQYYLNEDYLRKYNQSQLDEVNQKLDHDVVRKLGYEIQTMVKAPVAS